MHFFYQVRKDGSIRELVYSSKQHSKQHVFPPSSYTPNGCTRFLPQPGAMSGTQVTHSHRLTPFIRRADREQFYALIIKWYLY